MGLLRNNHVEVIALIKTAGLPATTTESGTDFVTTLQAPTIEFEPITTPGNRKALAPIKTLQSTLIDNVSNDM